MTTQQALAEVLQKFGTVDYKNRTWAKIALHRSDNTDLLSAETVRVINSLPWAFDDSETIKYCVKTADQVKNLEVWKL